ncbi:hypothetical protein SDC9_157202 [bioreactor metagenome]|uniref:Uncharacterized protein n=1 Tax=bioreactor metagenome TaxID=1076179 RepID=A0A645F9A0_9ZZZZ
MEQIQAVRAQPLDKPAPEPVPEDIAGKEHPVKFPPSLFGEKNKNTKSNDVPQRLV